MRIYLESNKFYVINENKMVYEVQSYQTYGGGNYATIDLQLVAGWDYIDPDNSNAQGWVNADRFVEEVQDDSVSWHLIHESMIEALSGNDYYLIDEVIENDKRLKNIIVGAL